MKNIIMTQDPLKELLLKSSTIFLESIDGKPCHDPPTMNHNIPQTQQYSNRSSDDSQCHLSSTENFLQIYLLHKCILTTDSCYSNCEFINMPYIAYTFTFHMVEQAPLTEAEESTFQVLLNRAGITCVK